jgi:hypothetical protein
MKIPLNVAGINAKVKFEIEKSSGFLICGSSGYMRGWIEPGAHGLSAHCFAARILYLSSLIPETKNYDRDRIST